MELAGKKTLVVGLGKSGLAAARFLQARGAQVTANDAAALEKINGAAVLQAQGIEIIAGSHPAELFENADLIIASPGVPLALEPFQKALSAGVEIISEIKEDGHKSPEESIIL